MCHLIKPLVFVSFWLESAFLLHLSYDLIPLLFKLHLGCRVAQILLEQLLPEVRGYCFRDFVDFWLVAVLAVNLVLLQLSNGLFLFSVEVIEPRNLI